MHGNFGRDSTFNNMAPIDPDFKAGFDDPVPVSNADIAPTIAHILGPEVPSHGKSTSRAILEALSGGDATPALRRATSHLRPPAVGRQCVNFRNSMEGAITLVRALFGEASRTKLFPVHRRSAV
jgi:hypothetical protein